MADKSPGKRPGPWSLRDITVDAKAAARRRARAAGMPVGAWVNAAILAQARQEENRQVPAVPEGGNRLPVPVVVPDRDLGPFWRWLRKRLGIVQTEAPHHEKGVE